MSKLRIVADDDKVNDPVNEITKEETPEVPKLHPGEHEVVDADAWMDNHIRTTERIVDYIINVYDGRARWLLRRKLIQYGVPFDYDAQKAIIRDVGKNPAGYGTPPPQFYGKVNEKQYRSLRVAIKEALSSYTGSYSMPYELYCDGALDSWDEEPSTEGVPVMSKLRVIADDLTPDVLAALEDAVNNLDSLSALSNDSDKEAAIAIAVQDLRNAMQTLSGAPQEVTVRTGQDVFGAIYSTLQEVATSLLALHHGQAKTSPELAASLRGLYEKVNEASEMLFKLRG